MNQKKGLSGVITVLILITLVMAATGIIWTVINKIVKESLEEAEACFGNYEEVTINSEYTCYNSIGEGNVNVQFSINIGDIEIDELLISIATEDTSKTFKINNELQGIESLGPYPSDSGDVKLPGKNSGLTYIASGFSSEPVLIRIAPVINNNQCEVYDSLSEIVDCLLLV